MPADGGRPVLLIVEDEPGVRSLLVRALEAPGREIVAAASGQQARAELAARSPSVLVLDLGLPDVPGVDILAEALAQDPNRMVVVLTARADERSVVEAMRRGAMEYLTKPFEAEDLQAAVERAFQKARQSREASGQPAAERPPLEGLLIGKSPKMVELYKMIGMLSGSDVPVLIAGESGTGKELVARALHLYGPRGAGPFVAVDCVSLPASLLEAELFGYERGAFTGAVAAKPGKFELADQGTLFLDEVGNVPLELQAKLLRTLQERTSQRLGSNQSVRWNARLVSATNAPLKELAGQGKFREDLLFRLSGTGIHLPPLRERLEDLPLLAEHFLAKGEARKARKKLSAEALLTMQAYRWPGNVRELEHAMSRAAAVSRSVVIGPEDLPEEVRDVKKLAALNLVTSDGKEGLLTLEDMKRRYARHALAVCGGNKTEAAKLLDIDRSTLNALLKEPSL